MLAFAGMLVPAAKDAGMKVPEFDKDEKWNNEEFPHFTVFCNVQLGKSMRYPGEHFENAKAIASIPEDKIRLVTADDLKSFGVII